MRSPSINNNYIQVFQNLKEKIGQARQQAVLSLNVHLLKIYWEIGSTIAMQEKEEAWGAKIVEKLSIDLRLEFPEMKGFSPRNLRYMRDFALAYPGFSILQPVVAKLKVEDNQDNIFLQPLVAKIPWSHHIILLNKVKDEAERLFYINKTIQNNWSKSVLSQQIDSNLYTRQGKAITNFENTLPKYQSDLARETIKSPYLIDFIGAGEEIQERELEKALIQNIKKFMLELGRGFAYVGNQYNIEVAGDDYFLDLLFYNYHLHCFVVFELKVGEFKPEYAGKLNFYINTIDEQIKGENNQTIGILLCKTPNQTVVKYALKGIDTPMGIAEYDFVKALPKELKSEMPTIEELEAELEREYEELKSPADQKLEKIKNLISQLNYEEAREKLNPKYCMAVFKKAVLPLKHSIEKSLVEINGMFLETISDIGFNSTVYYSEDNALNDLKGKQVNGFKLSFWFNAFKKTGTKSFNLWHSLFVQLDESHYTVLEPNKPGQYWLKKLYHQYPDKNEIQTIVENFKILILDSIDFQLERIKTMSQ